MTPERLRELREPRWKVTRPELLDIADAAMEAEKALELVIASAPEIHGDGRKPERTWGMSLSLEPIRKAIARLRKARGAE